VQSNRIIKVWLLIRRSDGKALKGKEDAEESYEVRQQQQQQQKQQQRQQQQQQQRNRTTAAAAAAEAGSKQSGCSRISCSKTLQAPIHPTALRQQLRDSY
jgi:biotin carboxyl carrier protein